MFAAETRILVVDDMVTMRKIVRKHLMDLGLKDIKEADDGSTAWPMIELGIASKLPFDLIICDWNMPNMKGIDLLKKVRAHPDVSKTPFLLVTAEAEIAQISQAISAGVSDYVVKPFSNAVFTSKIASVWKKVAQK